MAGTAPACCFSRAGDVVALATPNGLQLHSIVASHPGIAAAASSGATAPTVVMYPKLSFSTSKVGPIKLARQIQSTPLFVLVGSSTESAAVTANADASNLRGSSVAASTHDVHAGGGKAHKKKRSSGTGSGGGGGVAGGGSYDAASHSTENFRGSDRVVSLYDLQNDEVLSEIHCETAVLNVHANTSRLVIILERTTYLYDLLSMRLVQQFRTTTPVNRFGLGTLSEVTESAGGVPGTCFYAFPSSGAFYMVRTRSAVDSVGGGSGGASVSVAGGGADPFAGGVAAGHQQQFFPPPSSSPATTAATPGPSASAFHSERKRGDSVATSEFLFEYDIGARMSSNESPPQAGDVVLVDGMNGAWIGVVAAHRHPIVSLALSGSGSRMATCSAQGTNIHIYSIPSGQLMFQLRRGQAASRIWALQFNRTAEMLVASSSTGTVHLFYIGAKDIRWSYTSPAAGTSAAQSSLFATAGRGVVITKGAVIGETGIRSFGKIHLATSSRVIVASFSENSRVLTIAIAPSSEGSQSSAATVDRRWLLASYRVDCECRQLGETLLEG